MSDAVRNFNAQLEHLAELTVVVIIGALLPEAAPAGALWWFIRTVLLLALCGSGKRRARHRHDHTYWRDGGVVPHTWYRFDVLPDVRDQPWPQSPSLSYLWR